jgi:hypothetical protein
MKISNRVFWGGVVIVSSGLIGQVIAQEKTAKFTEVEAQSFILLNKDGTTAGRFAVNESTGIPHIVLVKGAHSFGVTFADKAGPTVMLTRNGKQVLITADGLDAPVNKGK